MASYSNRYASRPPPPRPALQPHPPRKQATKQGQGQGETQQLGATEVDIYTKKSGMQFADHF